MSDAESAQLWKELGKMQGGIEGHETRIGQLHADIKDIRNDIVGLRAELVSGNKEVMATVAGCFAEQEKRISTTIDKANNAQNQIFEAHLAAVASGGQIDLKQVLSKPVVGWGGGAGLAAIGMAIIDYMNKH